MQKLYDDQRALRDLHEVSLLLSFSLFEALAGAGHLFVSSSSVGKRTRKC